MGSRLIVVSSQKISTLGVNNPRTIDVAESSSCEIGKPRVSPKLCQTDNKSCWRLVDASVQWRMGFYSNSSEVAVVT